MNSLVMGATFGTIGKNMANANHHKHDKCARSRLSCDVLVHPQSAESSRFCPGGGSGEGESLCRKGHRLLVDIIKMSWFNEMVRSRDQRTRVCGHFRSHLQLPNTQQGPEKCFQGMRRIRPFQMGFVIQTQVSVNFTTLVPTQNGSTRVPSKPRVSSFLVPSSGVGLMYPFLQ